MPPETTRSPADGATVRALVRWFRARARDLPWRERPLHAPRDPYRVLVSEIMLQQTQATRVAERYDEFLHRFPTVERLAGADEAEILAAWAGLGYYRRARLLHACAKAIRSEHAARFPRTAADLARLPGLGRYTAGAVASLAFGDRSAAVDANVTRVLLRVQGRRLAASDPRAAATAWSLAERMLQAAPRLAPGLVNEALIELGATVCTPRSPACAECPISNCCVARHRGLEHAIPAAKAKPPRKPLYFASVIVRDGAGNVAVRRRPSQGLWAGMHEAPTVESLDRAPTEPEVRLALGLPGRRLDRLGAFTFLTTHRECRFEVFSAPAPRVRPADWRFAAPGELATLALSSAHRRVLIELGEAASPAPATRPAPAAR